MTGRTLAVVIRGIPCCRMQVWVNLSAKDKMMAPCHRRRAEITLPWREDFNGVAYVPAGRGSVGAERRPVHLGQTAVFGAGSSLTVRADEKQDSHGLDSHSGGSPPRAPPRRAWSGGDVAPTQSRGMASKGQ